MKQLIYCLIVLLLINIVKCQHVSPCPEIFRYEPNLSEPGKWAGILNINSEYPLAGAWVKIILDRKVLDLKSNFGQVSSTENKEFLLRDGSYNLIPNTRLQFPISVSYSQDEPIPSLVSIRLNGKNICPVSNKDTNALISNCPGVFSYNKERQEEGIWFGTLTLETEFELKGLWIRIALDQPAELLINEFGEVRTADNINYVISNKNYTLSPNRPFRVPFWVKYSPRGSIPKIHTVRLNGRTICGHILPEDNNKKIILTPQLIKHLFENSKIFTLGQSPSFVVTSASTFPPPRVQPITTNPVFATEIFQPISTTTRAPLLVTVSTQKTPTTTKRIIIPPTTRATTTRTITTRTTTTTTEKPENIIVSTNITEASVDTSDNAFVSCGTVVPQSVNLIIGGDKASSGLWPWHGAIYLTKPQNLDYICGMSLISERHALTAAHCVIESISTKKVRDPRTVHLYFGLLNRKDFAGPTVQSPRVQTIIVHPEYKVSENDIAVIKFERPVKFTNWVRPACLWEGDTDMRYIVNQTGTVVGFGVTDVGSISDELLYANILVVDTPTCIFSHRDFYSKYTSLNTFCAGNLTQSAVCNGDSGGAMVFKRDGTDVWQIRGIVSTAVRNVDTGLCDYNYYAIFTDVSKYTDWIEKALTT